MPKITIIDGSTTTVYEDIYHYNGFNEPSHTIAVLKHEDSYQIIGLDGAEAKDSLQKYITDYDGPCELAGTYVWEPVYEDLSYQLDLLAEQYDDLDTRYKASKAERDTILKLFERLTVLCAKNVMSKEFNEEYVLLQKEAMEFFNTID